MKIKFLKILLFLFITFSQVQNKYSINDIFEKDGILYDKIDEQKINGEVYTIIKKKIFKMGQVVEGKKEGFWNTWYKDEYLLEENFNDGIIDGRMSFFYKNGQKKWRHTYRDGVRDGLTTHWYSNGKKSKEGSFVNGDSIGLWNFWDENGNIIDQKQFRNRNILLNQNVKSYILKEDIIE